MKSNKTANNQSIGQPNLAGLFLLGELTPDDLTLTGFLSRRQHSHMKRLRPSLRGSGGAFLYGAFLNFRTVF
jgi:hypothetical protein